VAVKTQNMRHHRRVRFDEERRDIFDLKTSKGAEIASWSAML
jgi:hypothetical protein